MPALCAGKNRPLDEDELEFLDAVIEKERAAEQQWKSEEQRELEAYQEVCLGSCVACVILSSDSRSGGGRCAVSAPSIIGSPLVVE